MAQSKVLITTSGLGTRLGDLTKYTNKTLVRLGRKPILSYILESYPASTQFVITLGYKAELVQDFLALAHPQLKIEFAYVDIYDGPGSSLGYSMLQARHLIECPFIFHASDTLVTGRIPPPDSNWVGYVEGSDGADYSTLNFRDTELLSINPKGSLTFQGIHIGLVGVNDHEAFWNALESRYLADPANSALNDCAVINQMLESRKYSFRLQQFDKWIDLGNTKALTNARREVEDQFDNLEKADEAIYVFPDRVIKFFADSSVARKRVARAKYLGPVVPAITEARENFYAYNLVHGELLSSTITPEGFRPFVDWLSRNLWRKVELNATDRANFQAACLAFYRDKTEARVAGFLKKNRLLDQEEVCNGVALPSTASLLAQIPWDVLQKGEPVTFHGDLHFENVLKTDDGYKLLDWRHEFGDDLFYGDIYYDLAKLNHGMEVNHDIVRQELFTVDRVQEKATVRVNVDIMRRDNLVRVQQAFYDWLVESGYDVFRVALLTNLIYLNIASLHHSPYDMFLYYFGKTNLARLLRDRKQPSAAGQAGVEPLVGR